MIKPIDLLLLALATWRIASLMTAEDGPWHVFLKAREKTTLGGLLDCLWCCSVWVALALVALVYFEARAAVSVRMVIEVLAVSAGAIAFDKWGA